LNIPNDQPPLHVVFGATGSIGAEIVKQLSANSEPVRAVVRTVPEIPEQAEYVELNATQQTATVEACQGASYIYHCISVPYHQWSTVMPSVTKNVLEGAIQAQAKLVFIGNVYGYGNFQDHPATESHPLAATTNKGTLRNNLESMLWEAHGAKQVEVVIPRFPDFYGPGVVNGLMKPIFTGAISGKKSMWPAALNVDHDLVFIEDAARACIELATCNDSYGESWHVPGAGPLTGQKFIEMAYRAAGSKPAMGTLQKWMLSMAGLFNADAKEMIELLYEFSEPLTLNGGKFTTQFPNFKFTTHEHAVDQTVQWYKSQSNHNAQ